MTGGNIAALAQKDVKRMLAYSSIAHAGYILVGVAAYNELGTSAMLFYLFAYAFMNVGAFAVIIAVVLLKNNDLNRMNTQLSEAVAETNRQLRNANVNTLRRDGGGS